MADELNDSVPQNEPQEPTNQEPTSNEPSSQNDPPKLSAVEQKALEQGWRPKDEWDGDPEDWVSAKEFVRAGELFDKIDKLNRKVTQQDQLLNDLKKHHKQVKETEFKRALEQLKAAKVQALDEGNNAAVVEIDERIAQTKEAAAFAAAQESARPQEPVAPNPQVVAWMNRNPWYEREPAMKIYAEQVAQEAVLKGERNPTKILEEVETKVKKEFAHKFNNPNRNKPGAVEGAGSKGNSQKKDDFTLTDDERRVMNRFVKAGVMSEKEYIDELKATRKGA